VGGPPSRVDRGSSAGPNGFCRRELARVTRYWQRAIVSRPAGPSEPPKLDREVPPNVRRQTTIEGWPGAPLYGATLSRISAEALAFRHFVARILPPTPQNPPFSAG